MSPVTAAVQMKRADASVFEYVWYESNYAMTNLLTGTRVRQREANSRVRALEAEKRDRASARPRRSLLLRPHYSLIVGGHWAHT